LHHAVGFDVGDRYRRLRDFSRQAGFEDQADWLTDRLAYLGSSRE
jgi:hypothetical protein